MPEKKLWNFSMLLFEELKFIYTIYSYHIAILQENQLSNQYPHWKVYFHRGKKCLLPLFIYLSIVSFICLINKNFKMKTAVTF